MITVVYRIKHERVTGLEGDPQNCMYSFGGGGLGRTRREGAPLSVKRSGESTEPSGPAQKMNQKEVIL